MSSDEGNGWLMREAEHALDACRRNLAAGDCVVAVQQAQACVEYCTRAVIATYGQPSWGDSHTRDLRDMLDHQGAGIRHRFGPDTLRDLRQLAGDDGEMSPWHTRAMYGYRDDAGTFHPPLEICTREASERGLLLAQRSFATVGRFLQAW